MAERAEFAWNCVMGGAYAMGPYRVQGHGRKWHWWHVVQLDADAPRGTATSCKAAMVAAERDFRAEHSEAPPQ